MAFDTKRDVPTMIANYRKERCAEELITILTLAKNIDIKVLKEIIPELSKDILPDFFEESADKITKYTDSLNTFCQIIQNAK